MVMPAMEHKLQFMNIKSIIQNVKMIWFKRIWNRIIENQSLIDMYAEEVYQFWVNYYKRENYPSVIRKQTCITK